MIELKPCPFCGGSARLVQDRHSMNLSSYVSCDNCDAKTGKFIMAFEYSSDEKAIEAWNRRVKDG